jgi:hypothetical protein
MEVAGALEKRGHRVAYYRVSGELEVDEDSLLDQLRAVNPELVVLFHVLGMYPRNPELPREIRRRSGRAMIIEDCAHALIDPDEIQLLDDRHYCIDSLRKVSALQGARLFAFSREALPAPGRSMSVGRAICGVIFLLWHIVLWLTSHLDRIAFVPGIKSLRSFLWRVSERLFEAHNARIGTATESLAGFPHDLAISRCLALERIRDVKAMQADQYQSFLLTRAPDSPVFLRLEFRAEDLGRLKFFPVKISKARLTEMLDFFCARSIFVDTLYDDSPHCKECAYVMLPLGQHLRQAQIDEILATLEQFEEHVYLCEK